MTHIPLYISDLIPFLSNPVVDVATAHITILLVLSNCLTNNQLVYTSMAIPILKENHIITMGVHSP